MKEAILQLALEFVDLDRAIRVAEESVKGGADWLEAGTPLIKSEGLEAVTKLKAKFPDKLIVADMKVMDAGRIEVESAAKAGADLIECLGVAPDATIRECIKAARNYGAKIVVDTIGIKNVSKRAPFLYASLRAAAPPRGTRRPLRRGSRRGVGRPPSASRHR